MPSTFLLCSTITSIKPGFLSSEASYSCLNSSLKTGCCVFFLLVVVTSTSVPGTRSLTEGLGKPPVENKPPFFGARSRARTTANNSSFRTFVGYSSTSSS